MESVELESDYCSLGHVLVVGGTGFIGTHLVQNLVTQPTISSISVISRHPPPNPLDNVTYYTSALTNESRLHSLLFKTQPRIIFHLASPSPDAPSSEHQSTTILGTKTLLKCAAKSPFVKAFIYTSALASVQQPSNQDVPLTEATAILHTSSSHNATAYQRAKGIADAAVLAANGPMLRTVCLRLPDVYGEGDQRVIPGFMALLRKGQQTLQIGKNERFFEYLYVENAVHAHLLAAEALLRVAVQSGCANVKQNIKEEMRGVRTPDGIEIGAENAKVDGEPFFITDGRPLPYYTFARRIWSIVGDKSEESDVRIVSFALVLLTVSVTEWLYWLFTAGRIRPDVTRREVRKLEGGMWVSIEKARESLKYETVVEGDEGLRRAVLGEVWRWEMGRLVDGVGGGV